MLPKAIKTQIKATSIYLARENHLCSVYSVCEDIVEEFVESIKNECNGQEGETMIHDVAYGGPFTNMALVITKYAQSIDSKIDS